MREVTVRSSESLQERTADKHIYTTRQPVLVCAILAQWHGAHTGTSVAARTGYGHMHQLVTVPEAAEPYRIAEPGLSCRSGPVVRGLSFA